MPVHRRGHFHEKDYHGHIVAADHRQSERAMPGNQLRGQFMQIARLLLAVSPDADSELMTTYVKFTINTAPQSPVYAAIWLKNSKRLIVGLALPEEYEAEGLGPALPGTMYKGLTKYFVVERGGVVPKGFAEWAGLAYQNALSAETFGRLNLPQEKNFDGRDDLRSKTKPSPRLDWASGRERHVVLRTTGVFEA